MKPLRNFAMLLLCLTALAGCAGVGKETSRATADQGRKALTVTDISRGLPSEGLWRQNIALVDLGGKHFDIVTPPPRKVAEGQKRPFIFTYDDGQGRWIERKVTFPAMSTYDYGSIAVGDLNKDNLPDLVLATHTSDIVILLNDGKNGFAGAPLQIKEPYRSRAVALADVNGDGWLDIVAVSEASFGETYKPAGILVALNDQGKGWKAGIIEESRGLYSDSLAIGDVDGDGNRDIIIAPHTAQPAEQKVLWRGDGKGSFTPVNLGATPEERRSPGMVGAGDIDGDGKDEVVFLLHGRGADKVPILAAYRWGGDGLRDISAGLKPDAIPLVFDLCDIDGDGRKELVLLTFKGLRVYRYAAEGWSEVGYHPIPGRDAVGAFSLRAVRQRDGSVLIVYNQGSEEAETNKGIKALLLK